MVADALKGYIQLANGLTDVTKDRASSAAKSLVAQSPELLGAAASTAAATAVSAAVQAQSFAEDLLVTSRDNRAILIGIIRTEVERAVAALGFAKESEVDAVRHKVDQLEETVEGLGEDTSFATPTLRAALTPTKKSAKKVVAKKAAPTKAAPKKVVAKKRPSQVSAAANPTRKTAPATSASTKATATKPPKKVAPKKVVATKAAPANAPAPTVGQTVEVPVGAPEAPATPSISPVSVAATPLAPAAPLGSAPLGSAAETSAPDVVDLTRSQATSPVGDRTQGE